MVCTFCSGKVKVKYSVKTSTTQTLEGQENVELSLLSNTVSKQGSRVDEGVKRPSLAL